MFRTLGAAAATAVLLLAATQVIAASAITVIVNGQTVQFDQQPIERSGRVFVPLRGVFEHLGASVVYDNGLINATGNGRTVQLRIGSTNATVNGQAQTLDVAPFLIGARTYTPLRFISQALGANVDWNDNSRTVTVTGGQAPSGVQLTNLKPAPESVVAAKKPAVSGSFSASVDPNSVRITLDGRDVSSTTDISSNDFLFTPPYDLTPEKHTVHVMGRGTNGASFDQSWSFTSGTSSVSNYITNVRPANGTQVSGTFAISGVTLPHSSVHLVVIPSALIGGIFAISSGTYVADLTADGNGVFSQTVNVQIVPGGNVAVRITSIAPTTKESKTVDLSLKT